MTITTIGLYTSKSWFQVHCADAGGRMLRLISLLGAELTKLGHDARLMPARYVRAYVKTNKHDAADAEACCEAVQRPGMRFVPVKTEEQQGMLMIYRARDLLVRQHGCRKRASRAPCRIRDCRRQGERESP